MQDLKYELRRNKKFRNDFYQSKYDYYRVMNIWSVIISAVSNCFYWISDCQLFGRVAYETILPRVFMCLMLPIYLGVVKRHKSYKIAIPLSYLMIHGVMWCTIWAIYFLPIKQHANEGFVIMHLMFLAVGFGAPILWSVGFHCLLMADILLSYPINHYESLDLMISLGVPALVAVEFMLAIAEFAYADQFQLRDKLKTLSSHDQLTGVYNRNKMKDLCEPGTNILRNKNTSIVIIDIDFFKNVNDTYGHDQGDEVLKSVASLIEQNKRGSNDYVIRWGGEEFVIILTDCSLDEARKICERIRASVESYDNAVCKLTVSLGVSKYNGGDYNETMKNADKALYFAKENGRNQVRVFINGEIL